VNNIRDIESDKQAGKLSVPVRLGPFRARLYHWGLLLSAILAAMVYVLLNYRGYWQFLFLVTLPLLWRNGATVYRSEASQLDPMLKKTSLLTMLFVLTFGVGQLI
jgi:1,4-dihydroxy-2-naphthoate octaprenyltransferase